MALLAGILHRSIKKLVYLVKGKTLKTLPEPAQHLLHWLPAIRSSRLIENKNVFDPIHRAHKPDAR
jgi:hypothetical protein